MANFAGWDTGRPTSGYLSRLGPHLLGELERSQKRARYLHDPVLWAQDYLGIQLWSKQREILYAVRDNRKVAVAAAHGVGKSFVAAVLMAWWIDVHPLGADDTGAPQTFVASTAPFNDQISAILWNNLRILHSLAKRRYEEGKADHPLPGYITGDNKWKLDDGTLIGQGRKPPDNKTDSGYQGLHATYLLAIGDEAAGLHLDMVDALGNISTGPHNRMLLIANPTDPNSAMAAIWKREDPNWLRMHISAFDSPAITNEEGFDVSKAPALTGQDYVDEKLQEWGEDDPRYIARVLGQWAFDAGNTVFNELDLAKAANTVVRPDPNAKPVQGWDIARMGDDSTIGYQAIEGWVWTVDPETGEPIEPTEQRGLHIRRIGKWGKAPLTGNDPENLGSAERIHALAHAEGAGMLNIDASGIGSGVIDGLHTLNTGRYGIVEVFGGQRALEPRIYLNARAEQYFRLKRRMHLGTLDLDPKDTDLFDELRGIVYEHDSKGRIKIESKDDMKKRGVKSPDAADALWYSAVDVSPVTSSPLAGLKHGQKVSQSAWELVGARRHSAGYPV